MNLKTCDKSINMLLYTISKSTKQPMQTNAACVLLLKVVGACSCYRGSLHNVVMSLSASTLDIVHKYKDCVIISKKKIK